MVLFLFSSAFCMFPTEPSMPINMTIPLYLSKEDFVFTSKVQTSAQSSCLRFQASDHVDQTKPQDGAIPKKETQKSKKRVTFADHKGLSLTKVKVFSKFTDPIQIPVNIQEMLNSKLTLPLAEEDRLVLDFPPPSSDYLQFRQNLEKNLVSLEHCVLKDKAFAGTVKVKNVSFEKSVTLRVTFDSWKSHLDVGCEYVKDTYPSSYSDTFSFEVPLPAELRPNEHVEFAVCYQVDGKEFWDSNQGKNYHIIWSYMKRGCHADSSHFGIHFDRYGSPTCSHGLLPDWPSYAGYENIGPYY